MSKSILEYDTVALDSNTNELIIIDQTLLPGEIKLLRLKEMKDIYNAIKTLQVRGAPAIGVAAAIGSYIGAQHTDTEDYTEFYQSFLKIKNYLASARPTAVNLTWALDRMERCLLQNSDCPVSVIKIKLRDEALSIRAEDIEVCRSIGLFGLKLIKPDDGILTHCNAGQLATVKYGTATAPIYMAHEKGYNIHVYADETRPLLQGARLTTFELSSAGIDVTLICDSMAPYVMSKGKVQIVFTGCDRVAANGDTANKIGTLGVAISASKYGIPFYICAPTSTIDMSLKTGADIPVEERPVTEVTEMWYKAPMAAEGIKVYNPAFDVTDSSLITGIITEYGIAYPPFETSLRHIFNKKENAHA